MNQSNQITVTTTTTTKNVTCIRLILTITIIIICVEIFTSFSRRLLLLRSTIDLMVL